MYDPDLNLGLEVTRFAKVDEDAIMRGATALCRFIFPGYIVPREEMARAVLEAAADAGEDWMARLPEKWVARR